MGNKADTAKKIGDAILTEEKIASIMENTSFSREEIVKWHEGFIKDCPKGQLNKKKFLEVYKVFYPHGKADKFCSHVFKVFDTDNSGLIDFTELLVAISITAQGDAAKKLKIAFNMYDIDKNGFLDKKEMEQIIEAIYDLVDEEERKGQNAPKERVKMIMKVLDKDSNGVLSQEEFVEGCLKDKVLMDLLTPNPTIGY